ncbi:RNA processing factor [Lithospermum erythrorhizon]|uniref:RNA processing factor n=1 Tax=Lithospermum erythrorhizon TaxID=34254 RepID=A0AAV3PNB3_LITER
MEEDLQKRNTDCVYFLASPLTCKKGSECEYRHSEMARLNPRDCYYWLSGTCLNASCAFRHPPLDGGRTETSSETAAVTTPNVSAVSVTKTNVPCYYFYNGYCNKGELCTFMHGPVPSNNVHTQKYSNARPNSDGPPVEKKGSAGSDTGSAPGAKSFRTGNQQTTRRPVMRKESELENLQPSPSKVAKRSASPCTPRSIYEDAAADGSISPVAAAGSVPRSPHASSPGFDVLVDNGSDELVYEDDYNYVVDHDGDSGEPVADEYDFKGRTIDDPEYTGSAIFYEKERHEYDYHFGAQDSLGRVREGRSDSRRRVLDRVVPARRSRSPRGQAYNGLHSVDLRDRLKRRRMTDDRSHNAYSGRHESSRPISRSRERPRYQVERHIRRPMELNNSRSHIGHEGRFTRSSFDKSRLQQKPQLSSKVSGNAADRKRSYAEESVVFKGPKTLAQIKDEKNRRGSREPSESSLDGLLDDNFVAPKTLSEILEEKRRLGSLVNGNNDSS